MLFRITDCRGHGVKRRSQNLGAEDLKCITWDHHIPPRFENTGKESGKQSSNVINS